MKRHLPVMLVVLVMIGSGAWPRGGHAAPLPMLPRLPTAPESATGLPVNEVTIPGHGVELFIRTVGGRYAGPTLVVLHGGPGISHEYLRPLEALATAEYRVAFYDQRGAGRSTAAADLADNRLDDYDADLEAVRAALGTTRIDLAGHSWGGIVAMNYATQHREHVRALMLFGSGPPTYNDMNAGKWYFAERQTHLQMTGIIPDPLPPIEGDDCGKNLLANLPAYYFDPRHPATRDLAGATCHEAVNKATWKANEWYDLKDGLATFRAPTLILHGEADPFRQQMASAIASAMTKARPKKVILPRCGHLLWEECPEPFFKLVRGFLAARP